MPGTDKKLPLPACAAYALARVGFFVMQKVPGYRYYTYMMQE